MVMFQYFYKKIFFFFSLFFLIFVVLTFQNTLIKKSKLSIRNLTLKNVSLNLREEKTDDNKQKLFWKNIQDQKKQGNKINQIFKINEDKKLKTYYVTNLFQSVNDDLTKLSDKDNEELSSLLDAFPTLKSFNDVFNDGLKIYRGIIFLEKLKKENDWNNLKILKTPTFFFIKDSKKIEINSEALFKTKIDEKKIINPSIIILKTLKQLADISEFSQKNPEKEKKLLNDVLLSAFQSWEKKWNLLKSNLPKLKITEITELNFVDEKNNRQKLDLDLNLFFDKIKLKKDKEEYLKRLKDTAPFLIKANKLLESDQKIYKDKWEENTDENKENFADYLENTKVDLKKYVLTLNEFIKKAEEESKKKELKILLKKLASLSYFSFINLEKKIIETVNNKFVNEKDILLNILPKLAAVGIKVFIIDQKNNQKISINFLILEISKKKHEIETKGVFYFSIEALKELIEWNSYSIEVIKQRLKSTLEDKLGKKWKILQKYLNKLQILRMSKNKMQITKEQSWNLSVFFLFNGQTIFKLTITVLKELKKIENSTDQDFEKWLQSTIENELGSTWKDVRSVFASLEKENTAWEKNIWINNILVFVKPLFDDRNQEKVYALKLSTTEQLKNLYKLKPSKIKKIFTTKFISDKERKKEVSDQLYKFVLPAIAIFFIFILVIGLFLNQAKK